MKNLIKLAGVYLIADGVSSIFFFREQGLLYQMPRIIRVGIGIWLLKS